MKTRSFRYVSCLVGAALTCTGFARGFSIESVTFSPSNTVAPNVELRMIIDVTTPSQPEWLYAPTQVSSNANGIRVDVFPTSGLLTAIGSLRETVTLGAFPAGTYNYEVQLHPDFAVGWGTRTNRGTFIVQEPVSSAALVLIEPRDGQHFQPGDTVPLRASIANDTNRNWRVAFFDGEELLGETIPNGTVWWENASGGPHVITARATNSTGTTLNSAPANILVGPGPALPVVKISVQSWKTLEPCPVCFVPAVILTVERTSPTNKPLTVFLQTDGTARADEDYEALPTRLEIPAGTNQVQRFILVRDDPLIEGPEVVRVRLMPPPTNAPPTYLIHAYAAESLLVIGDDEAGAPEARLDLLEPADGTQFPSGATVQVSALGVWTRSEVYGPVEFYDGNTIIGRSSPLAVARPSIPCLPSVHTIQWTNPPAGQHVLSARTELSLNLWATSPPVRITVAPPPPQTVVRIDATQPIAEEDSTPLDRLSLVGVFTISRTGPTNDSRPVFVEYAGTATSQQDYPSLPWLVTIPAGATATELRVMPLADGLPEGIETLVARISNCPPETDPPMGIPCYAFDIDPAHQSATVFLRDDGVTRASLTITNPKDGANFNVGETVLIDVTAVDLDGYISHVDFFDGVQRIGESEIVFIRAPDPGTPIFHSLHWQGAAPGSHVLTARAADTHGTTLSSRLVQITVGPTSNQPPRIAITRPLAGTDFPLNAAIEVVAEARDTDGFVRRAEFFADGRKIGEQSILFTQPPQLGQTQTFTFVWRFPPPGPHLLTARVTDDHGARGQSASVEIRVNPPDQLPVLTVIARDTFAVEPGTNVPPNTASFAVRRFGTTNEALVVNYSMHGTAQNGADYEMLSGLATIQAGQRSVIVTARPLPDNLVEGIETVILRLEEPPAGPAGAYRLGFPHRALALVSDRPWVRSPSGVRCSSLIGGVVHVCFDAETGYNFRVEASSDLRNWETVFNSLAIDGALHFVDDEMATTSHRFYRLTPEPVVEVNN